MLFGANTLILIGGNTKESSHIADCWLAAGNLILSACAMGLGATVVEESMTTFECAEIKNKLGIPSDFTGIVPIVVGYPEGVITQISKSKPIIVSWHIDL